MGALLAGLGLAAVCTQAADAPSTPAPAGGIDEAKSQYDAIKSAHSSQEQQKLTMPVLPSPELKLDDIPFAPANLNPNERESAKAAKARKSQNWLLDAMEDAKKKAAHRDDGSKDGPKALGESDDLLADDAHSESSSKLDLATDDKKETRENRKLGQTAPDVVNPLASYMASWMSAGDLALLAPKSNATAESLPSLGPSGQPVGSPAVPDPAAALFDSFAKADRSTPSAKEETNPYLAQVTLPSAPSLTPPPTLPASPALTPAPAQVPAPEPARAPSPAEQFRNSRDDEKLFKPLKRF